jgi:hypothetical protein
MTAAVGSLIILATFSPAIIPASLVACLWASLNYAGMVTPASLLFFPSCFLHLSQNHSTDLLRAENLGLTIFNFHLNVRLSILVFKVSSKISLLTSKMVLLGLTAA